LPLVVLSALNIAVFLIAGIFSSRVTGTDSEALLKGFCGWLDNTTNKDFPQWTRKDWTTGDALFVSAYNGYRENLAYAHSCYAGDLVNGSSSVCNTMTVPRIESQINRAAPCPFAKELCLGSAMIIDSGPIDSHKHLGINAAPKDRIQVRKMISCVPIPVDSSFSSNWTIEKEPGVEVFSPSPPPGDAYRYYSVGSSWLFGIPVSNFTYVVSNLSMGFSSLPYNLE
jgi:hypothetical protein